MFIGSTRKNGCTYLALCEVEKTLQAEGVETKLVQMGSVPIRDCIGCKHCADKGSCVFADDMVNELIEQAKEADGFVFGSPVYYSHPSGQVLSLLDRLFYAGKSVFAHKPGAAVVTARRGGNSASLDALNKYFTIAQMPVVSSTYWNMVYGPAPELVAQDEEGLQTMRNLGRNMAWLLKCIQAGKDQGVVVPNIERHYRTNFNK